MLPFLKKYQEGSANVPPNSITRKPDEDDSHEEKSEDFDSIEIAAEEMLSAFDSGDVKALARAIRAAFEICDSEPHNEGPHNG